MLKARTNHASSALNGEIYVIGGKSPLSIVPRLPPAPQTPSPPLNPAAMAPHPNALTGDQRAPMLGPGTTGALPPVLPSGAHSLG